ncbi:MAG: nitrate reductase [Pseudomonadota bacterium]
MAGARTPSGAVPAEASVLATSRRTRNRADDCAESCRTTCPYCGVGCGVEVRREDGALSVTGDRDHPANAGRLCVKGQTLAETLSSESRLLHPQIRGSRCDWDAALDHVSERLRDTLVRHGPESIAFYLSGQQRTEDYYVANKLMKGFLGSANVDTNSRLCMASAVAAYKRAFGADYVPCSYSDLDDCDLLVLVGSNAAWTHPVLYRRMVASRKARADKRIVLIDPRATASADAADMHLAIRPGSDAFLFSGLLSYLQHSGHVADSWVEAHVDHAKESFAAARDCTPGRVAAETGLTRKQLEAFYRLFARTDRVVTFFSQGINQSATGTDKANAIINCHLATGRIARAGAGPFSITGQPNAMGGREVGGLANQLAAHMDFSPEDVDRVRRFWDAPAMAERPGLKAVDLFAAIGRGEVKFVWIMATNPAVSLPDSQHVREALRRCETVVVSDCVAHTDTTALADVLLPATGWGEKDGTVTNSERVISRQRAFREPAGEARHDWQIICDVATRLGFAEAFSYASPAAIFREHAALSAWENNGSRDFDIGALAAQSDEEFAAMAPQRWPLPASGAAPPAVPAFHPNRRMRMLPVKAEPGTYATEAGPSSLQRLLLNTGRLRDQWHTMTRTGLAPSLNRHRRFFSATLHPDTAANLALQPGDLLRIANRGGSVVATAALDPGMARDAIFLPIHWNDVFASAACVSALLPPITDPVSGQPQSKLAEVSVERIEVQSWTLLLMRGEIDMAQLKASYWSRTKVGGGELCLLADADPIALHDLVDESHAQSEVMAVAGQAPLMERRVWMDDGLAAALYQQASQELLPDPAWLERLLARDLPSPRWALLKPSPALGGGDALVCACYEVAQSRIVAAIAAGVNSSEALGRELRCGTGCGSCLPELEALLVEHADTRNSGSAGDTAP